MHKYIPLCCVLLSLFGLFDPCNFVSTELPVSQEYYKSKYPSLVDADKPTVNANRAIVGHYGELEWWRFTAYNSIFGNIWHSVVERSCNKGRNMVKSFVLLSCINVQSACNKISLVQKLHSTFCNNYYQKIHITSKVAREWEALSSSNNTCCSW